MMRVAVTFLMASCWEGTSLRVTCTQKTETGSLLLANLFDRLHADNSDACHGRPFLYHGGDQRCHPVHRWADAHPAARSRSQRHSHLRTRCHFLRSLDSLSGTNSLLIYLSVHRICKTATLQPVDISTVVALFEPGARSMSIESWL